MIQSFIDQFMKNEYVLEEKYSKALPQSYNEIVKDVIELLSDVEVDYSSLDPEKITCIDHGYYQGTLLFVIGVSEYEPSIYYYVKISYGSCSGCDTLQAIVGYGDEEPTKEQVKDVLTLALHIVQQLKKMD